MKDEQVDFDFDTKLYLLCTDNIILVVTTPHPTKLFMSKDLLAPVPVSSSTSGSSQSNENHLATLDTFTVLPFGSTSVFFMGFLYEGLIKAIYVPGVEILE